MRGAGVAAVVLLLAANRDAAGDACVPSAVVIGDDGLVRTIESELRSRGITVAGDGGATDITCAVHAEVAPDVDHHVRVTITDSDGRTVERLTADAGTAATAIESWARRDMSDPLLAGYAPAPPREPPVRDAAAMVAPRWRRIEVGTALDGGVSNDGAVWGGVRGRACAMVGDACVGAAVRYARDTELSGDTAALENGRSALDLTVMVELPLDRDRWSIVPAVGLGQTSLTAVRELVDEEESEQASSLHVLAAMSAGLRITGAWRARADLGLALSPFATERLGEMDGVDRQLAALPKARGWLGLGVSYEGL
jgi:hypothetical protein